MSLEHPFHYEESVYGRLEESVFEYMDEDMVDKFIPHLKKALYEELDRRRKFVTQVESAVHTLFPGEKYEATD